MLFYIGKQNGVSTSHPTRGEWIEMHKKISQNEIADMSHPTRGEWIEI